MGLGCMRLSTDADGEDAAALETIAAAAEAGITIFDTAHAYGAGETPLGRNERLVGRALRHCGAARRARIISKGGMTRVGGGWIPDGRARAIRADCEASLAALDGLAIDLYLIHAPDPRVPWHTSVRALAALLRDGAVGHVGLANVNRRELEEACELVDVAGIQVGLSLLDDSAVRGGLVEFCAERGIAVIAHSPLGGVRRAPSLARRTELVDIARSRNATPEEVALAWVLGLSPVVVAIPGARHPATVRSAARSVALNLERSDRERIASGFAWPQARTAASAAIPVGDAEVVLVMGIPGAGKSRHAEEYVARGYVRLNRDDRGGSLRDLNEALGETLASGARRIVLDNTYLTRASRSHVIEVAARHHASARCVWIDTPLAQAQVNLVERILARFGRLPEPAELRAIGRREPGIMVPTSQMRTLRELEPPSTDEGFAVVQRIPFQRGPKASRPIAIAPTGAVFVAAAALKPQGWAETIALAAADAPYLVFDWRPGATAEVLDADVDRLSAHVKGHVVGALCAHPAGAPVCWCRPPLPGLVVAFARAHGVDTSLSLLIGASPAHRTLATTLGARYLQV
ncbi:MAG TPA: aldo/keto reductase [Candidatus Saccharimonadales bacterium]|nr:aldo/keto reductase [Candidatus Saccharimonadales bacterium]